MKKTVYVCTLAAALLTGYIARGIVPGGSRMQTVHAATGFSVSSLSGTYGYSLQGQIGGAPVSGVGYLTADGSGGVTGTETVQIFGGGVQTVQFQGTYTVDSSTGCGDLLISYPPVIDPNNPVITGGATIPTASYHFVLVSGGAQVNAVRTDDGVSVTGSFFRQ